MTAGVFEIKESGRRKNSSLSSVTLLPINYASIVLENAVIEYN